MKQSAAFKKFCKKIGVDPNAIPEINSFEDACKVTGDDPKALPIVKHLPVARRKPVIALFKLEIITAALNGQWRADYTNYDEWKYFPYFKVKADSKRTSGFGLSFDVNDYWFTYTHVGVRLCFKTSDLARYAGHKFLDLYEDAYLFK